MGTLVENLNPTDLAAWFQSNKRQLPWRTNPNPYYVWISEIMLQQTQVATVLPYFDRFIGRFPTVNSLAQAPIEEVNRYWAGLGYYSRARNLHRAAVEIVEKGFPATFEGLHSLPGIGPYTAGAIASIAYEISVPIVDGNIERVFSRVFGRAEVVTHLKPWFWQTATELVKISSQLKISPRIFNQALMELGALVCKPREPKCFRCPLRVGCVAFQKDLVDKIPNKGAKKTVVKKSEKKIAIVFKGRVLLKKSTSGEWREGLWDFLDDSDAAPFKTLKTGSIQTKHVVTKHRITRTTDILTATLNKIPENLRWISLEEMAGQSPGLPIGAPAKKCAKEIIRHFAKISETHLVL